MPHDLTQRDFRLGQIDDYIAGDSRILAWQVVDADGNGVDISGATVAWELFERAYQTDAADVVLDGSDSGVTLETSSGVDPTIGEWETQLDPAATEDLWGRYTQRPRVEFSDGAVASWKGSVVITA